jgi:enolase|tara:strand:- start:883 stop:2136 length:1254 start_codon:yes stop_codon:yes gene_type:complete
MPKITNIKARQVFDSRGIPTIESEVYSDDGSKGSAIVPSGASTGTHEAFELRDIENKKYLGKSVLRAMEKVNGEISKALIGLDVADQKKIDKILIDLDGTEQKKRLGANAILSVSLASNKAAAVSKKIPLYKNLGNQKTLPVPLMNIINGGAHANNSLRIQEFMIRPDKARSFKEAVNICFLVIQKLKSQLNNNNLSTTVGDEGGFAPSLSNNEEAIEFILQAIDKAGFTAGTDISVCLDVAANELYKDKKYAVNSSKFISSDKTIEYYLDLIKKYPIKSIEDPFFEDDWDSWTNFTKLINKDCQVVGDDLFVTNKARLLKGINAKAGNSILIKPNQIGTLTETLDVIKLAQQYNYKTIISHRSGDSEDTFIADLAVATNSSQIKTGSLSRSERVAKYNRLLRIEDELGNSGKIAKV